jgi:hypothetical protein
MTESDDHVEVTEEVPQSFFVRWVVPLLLVVVIVVALALLTRVSTPVLAPGEEAPEGHLSSACWACHRSE